MPNAILKDQRDTTLAPVTVHRVFEATIRLTTRCNNADATELTLKDIKKWVAEHFNGCDTGDVTVLTVHETVTHLMINMRDGPPVTACADDHFPRLGLSKLSRNPSKVTCKKCRTMLKK